MTPIVTLEKCGRLARVIHILMSEKQNEMAAQLLKAFAFDPIAVFYDLERLEQMIDNDEEYGAKNLINGLAAREKEPPASFPRIGQ